MKVIFGILLSAVMSITIFLSTELTISTNTNLDLDKLVTVVLADGESLPPKSCIDVEQIGGAFHDRWCQNCTMQNLTCRNDGTCTGGD